MGYIDEGRRQRVGGEGEAYEEKQGRQGRSGVGEDTLIKEITRRLWKEGKVMLEKKPR